MPRSLATNMDILLPNSYRRDAVEIYLADNTVKYLSRGAVTRGADVYTNCIKTIGEITNSINAPVNRVSFSCQNIDSILGLSMANELRLLSYAFARYSRDYVGWKGAGTGLTAVEQDQFFGVVAGVSANETEINYDLVVDLESIGKVIASRTFSPKCPWTYKNGIECNSVSVLTSCPLHRAACEERGVEWEMGGWEFFEDPVATLPGLPVNPHDGTGYCFIADTLVWNSSGYTPIQMVKVGDRVYSFNKITGVIETKKVYNTSKTKYTGDMFKFSFESGREFVVKPNHPIWNSKQKMVMAKHWSIGDVAGYSNDELLLNDYSWRGTKLTEIEVRHVTDEWVYNLSVEDNADYFAETIGVSNSKPVDDPV